MEIAYDLLFVQPMSKPNFEPMFPPLQTVKGFRKSRLAQQTGSYAPNRNVGKTLQGEPREKMMLIQIRTFVTPTSPPYSWRKGFYCTYEHIGWNYGF